MKNNQSIDDPSITIGRRNILKKKLLLHKIYIDFYKKICLSLSVENKKGKVVELGSGAGFIKKFIPKAITSDILKLPNVDMQFSALKMSFEENSINAFVMIDVFHHIENVEQFLREANRCLKKEGQVIMIEPASTIFGKFIFKHFHHEPFNENARWTFISHGPLTSANSALPWIVFIRDKRKFQKKFPNFRVTKMEAHTPIKYLLSGGYTYPQLVPNFLISLVEFVELLLKPIFPLTGLFYTIAIKKIK